MADHTPRSSDLLPLSDLLRTSRIGQHLPFRPHPSLTARRTASPSSASPQTATDTRPCPACGGVQVTLQISWKGVTRYWWAPCDACVARREAAYAAALAHSAATSPADNAAGLAASGIARIAAFRFETFDGSCLQSPTQKEHPLAIAEAWLAAIGDLPHGDLRADVGPPPALYFYSPGKGRGKTHLAAALANAAHAAGKRVVFVEETSYLEQRWSCPLEALEALTALPGERGWLTVIDDLGQRAKAPPSVADAWYAVINRRWLRAGWTVFTSNKLPDELLAQGTINEATYSRLVQLIRKRVIFFAGTDQRLV